MARKPRKDVSHRPVRSPSQQEWTAAVGLASRLWGFLIDEQRRAWNVWAKSRRTSGQRGFTGINAPRLRDRQEPLSEPPASAAYSGKRILSGMVIHNWGGQITLKLNVSNLPGVRVTVWGSRPYKPGISVGIRCPRLGELPAPEGGVSDITVIYFRKHWEYIKKHGVELVGKRIFIQVRVELEGGAMLYEQASALIPPPED